MILFSRKSVFNCIIYKWFHWKPHSLITVVMQCMKQHYSVPPERCQYAVKAQNVTSSVVTVSWFTRYYCACTPMLSISGLCEDCAVANEIDKRNWQSVNHIPGIHDNGPRDHGVWRLTLTAYTQLLYIFICKCLTERCKQWFRIFLTSPRRIHTGTHLHRPQSTPHRQYPIFGCRPRARGTTWSSREIVSLSWPNLAAGPSLKCTAPRQ